MYRKMKHTANVTASTETLSVAAQTHQTLHPSPAGKVAPIEYLTPLNRQLPLLGGGMVGRMGPLHVCPQPLKQHFSPSSQSSSSEHSSTQIPPVPGGMRGQMGGGGRVGTTNLVGKIPNCYCEVYRNRQCLRWCGGH